VLSTCSSFHTLIKLEFFPYIFEKFSNIKFHENLSSGSRVVPCGHPRHDKANSHFSQFYEHCQKMGSTNDYVD
jgi:hypothetical protein